MVPGLAAMVVLLATASVPPPRAIYSPSLPACDALGLGDEDGVAEALDALAVSEPEPVETARLCEIAAAPRAPTCDDLRASIWVQEVTGTCQMPKPHPSLRTVTRPPRSRMVCDASGCSRDPMPMRGADGVDDDPNWGLAGKIAMSLYFPASRVAVASWPLPAAPPPHRRDRPPRA